MKSCLFACVWLIGAGLSDVQAATLSCPDLVTAVQVGTCPSEEELKHTFTGYCSDDAKAYKGETDVCTDFQSYKKLKNVALWESADGLFDAYVSCDLPKDALKRAKVSGIRVGKQGKLTQLVCTYVDGASFTYRTRAQCTVDSGAARCSADPQACKASCD